MLKVYMLVAVVGLVGGAVYGAYFYYKDTQARIQILTENAAKLEIATQTQKNTIDTLVQDAEKNAELAKELNTRLEAANDYKNELIGKLRKHDLSRLSQQKPALVEGKINNATKRLLAEFETITGAVPAVTDSATK
tara:strand:+ start:1648 stop:2055 length:408 start_codon:yes stop_codon:yes gene_type:complete